MGIRAMLVVVALAATAMTYPDRPGDAKGAPDIVAVTVTNTRTQVSFSVRFTLAPPLRLGKQWVDMLLISIDTPPIGPAPVAPGGEWRGADYALGTHGPAKAGVLTSVGWRESPLAHPKVVTRGRTVTMSVPRRLLGNPAWFRFGVAAARETQQESGAGFDVAPDRGTLKYVLR